MVTASWNGLVFAPVFFVWFRALDRRFPGSSLRAAALKVAINQVVVVLPINACFVVYTKVLENALAPKDKARTWAEAQGQIGRELVRKLTEDTPTILRTSCLVWVPTNLLNFMFVPQHLRVLPTIATSLLWTTFLSYMAHREPEAADCGSARGAMIT